MVGRVHLIRQATISLKQSICLKFTLRSQMKSVETIVWGPENCKRQTLRSNCSGEEFDTLVVDTDSMDVDLQRKESCELSVKNQVRFFLHMEIKLSLNIKTISRSTFFWRWLRIARFYPEDMQVGDHGYEELFLTYNQVFFNFLPLNFLKLKCS